MCDILRRLNSPVSKKQEYLSCLNDFSRICRNKKAEELFLLQRNNDKDKSDDKTAHNDHFNPIFLLNRNAERDNYTMDEVFTW